MFTRGIVLAATTVCTFGCVEHPFETQEIVDNVEASALNIQMFKATSGSTNHPSIELTVPESYKIVGGGALVNWQGGPGNLLTASYPKDKRTWAVASKDHIVASPATITIFAMALYDPDNAWDVVIIPAVSEPAHHPTATATIPQDYVLTGGGAYAPNEVGGAGQLLTASYPDSPNSWTAKSKDHGASDPQSVIAYAIGLRSRTGAPLIGTVGAQPGGAPVAHPMTRAYLLPSWKISCGGARDEWSGSGNLLTGSYPQDLLPDSFPLEQSWVGTGKDHLFSSPSTITTYVVGLRSPLEY